MVRRLFLVSNPVTQSLISQTEDEPLAVFVQAWDALEELIIRLNRSGAVRQEDNLLYSRLQLELHQSYPALRDVLDPDWRRARKEGNELSGDPFRALLLASGPDEFVRNWDCMQMLPAARQALNEYILDRIQAESK